MTCDDADLLLAAYAVGSLEDDDTALLRAHVGDCPRCQTEGARYAAAAELIPLGAEQRVPPPELRSRIMAQVHAEAAAGRQPDRLPRLDRLWRRIPVGRGLTLAGAAAAIAAVGLAAVAVREGRSTPAGSTLTARACGTTAAPSACGTLTWDPSTREAVLAVTGLPRQTGSYEVWLVGADHSVAPAAFLTEQPDGRTWTAAIEADLGGYLALAATREPLGGSPGGPTGPEVFQVGVPGGSS